MPYLQMVRGVVVVVADVVEFVCAEDLNALGTSSGKIFHEQGNRFQHRHRFGAERSHHYFDEGCSGKIAKFLETLVFCCLVARRSHLLTSDHCSFE